MEQEVYLNQNVVVVENLSEHKMFVFDRDKRLKYTVNKDMVKLLKLVYDGKFKLSMVEDTSIIDNLLENGILVIDKQNRLHNFKHIGINNYAKLFVELTSNCNQNCKHCYGNFGKDNINIDIFVLKELLRQSVEVGTYEVDLTGGEPVLYPHLDEVLEVLYESGMIVSIFTNLTLLNNKVLEWLKKYKVRKIITSIDSLKSEKHNDFRGQKSALELTLHALEKIKQANIDVRINTVVGEHNKDEIWDIRYYAEKNGFEHVCGLILPQGRARLISLDRNEHISILRDIYFKKEKCVATCGIGKRFLYIRSNGEVSICPSLPMCNLGNIISGQFNIKDMWQKLHNLYGDLECNKRKECSKKTKCGGGCRAKGLLYANSLKAPDIDNCFIHGVI